MDFTVRGSISKGYSIFFTNSQNSDTTFVYEDGEIKTFKKVEDAEIMGNRIKEHGLFKKYTFHTDFKE